MALGKTKVPDDDPRPEGDGHLVSEPEGGGDCHGGYRSLLETGVEHLGSGEEVPFAFGERASHQASAGTKNGPERQRNWKRRSDAYSPKWSRHRFRRRTPGPQSWQLQAQRRKLQPQPRRVPYKLW